MPFISEILLSKQDWDRLLKADNASKARSGFDALMKTGRMGAVVYNRDKNTGACHFNFVVVGAAAKDQAKARQKLKLLVSEGRANRQRHLEELFGGDWEATLSEGLPN